MTQPKTTPTTASPQQRPTPRQFLDSRAYATDALAKVLAAIDAHDHRPRPTAPPPRPGESPFLSLAEFTAVPTGGLEGLSLQLVRDPVGRSLRLAVRMLGERFFDEALTVLGDRDLCLDLLREFGEEAANADPRRYGYRVNVMDSRFNGIGDGEGSVGWWS